MGMGRDIGTIWSTTQVPSVFSSSACFLLFIPLTLPCSFECWLLLGPPISLGCSRALLGLHQRGEC